MSDRYHHSCVILGEYRGKAPSQSFWEECQAIRHHLRWTLCRLFLLRLIVEEHEDIFVSVMAPLTLLFRSTVSWPYLQSCFSHLQSVDTHCRMVYRKEDALCVLNLLREPRLLLHTRESYLEYTKVVLQLGSVLSPSGLAGEENDCLDAVYLPFLREPFLSFITTSLERMMYWVGEKRIACHIFKHFLRGEDEAKTRRWYEEYLRRTGRAPEDEITTVMLTQEERRKVSLLFSEDFEWAKRMSRLYG
jgi:hypothetical protein